MIREDGTRVFQQEQIGQLIAEQQQPGEKMDFERDIVNVRMTEEELKFALDTSPRNTAAGIDRRSYPVTASRGVAVLQRDIGIDSNQTGGINEIKYRRR